MLVLLGTLVLNSRDQQGNVWLSLKMHLDNSIVIVRICQKMEINLLVQLYQC